LLDSRDSLRASLTPYGRSVQCLHRQTVLLVATLLRGLHLPRSASLRSQTVAGVRRATSPFQSTRTVDWFTSRNRSLVAHIWTLSRLRVSWNN